LITTGLPYCLCNTNLQHRFANGAVQIRLISGGIATGAKDEFSMFNAQISIFIEPHHQTTSHLNIDH
jgi:hypothetical protein